MKLTLHSFTWHTMIVVATIFAALSSTVLGMASESASRSLDSEGGDRDGNVASFLRRLPTFTGSVTGFDLMDVTKTPNQLWKSLYNGAIAVGPNRPYSIKAIVAGDGIGSVVMTLNAVTAVENLAPYAMCKDNFSDLDLISCGPSVYGFHTISAKACSGANGGGVCSALNTVDFQIVPGRVMGFDLMDVTKMPNQLWKSLYNGAIAVGPNRPYSIKANVFGGGIGSVVMKLNALTTIENVAPYAMCKDNYSDLDLISCGLSVYGTHTISAKACSDYDGKGFCGPETTTTFSISP
jgi:hypothetical protein